MSRLPNVERRVREVFYPFPPDAQVADRSGVAQEAEGLTFVCERHQFASRTVSDREDLIALCPHCVCEDEQKLGRLRYAAFRARQVLGI